MRRLMDLMRNYARSGGAPSARARLAPQMAEYESWGARMAWRPFIMYFQPPNLQTVSCHTDSLGFRFSADPDGNVARVDQWSGKPCSIVLGNSVAFSVGAASDADSLAARMSRRSGETWLNFSGRAFAASQEYLTFMFHRHYVGSVKRIVLFSGANDLFLYYMPKMFDETFGVFFFSDVFDKRLNVPAHRSWTQLRSQPRRPDLDAIIAERRPHRERAVRMLVRSLENWQILASGLGIEFVYALQPVRTWVKTPWTHEEQELTEEHRRRGGTWNTVLAKVMDEEHHRWYRDQLAEHCSRLGISFIDMNDVLSNHPRNTEWLFIDYLHLTNAAYDICAQALTQMLQPPEVAPRTADHPHR